MSSDEPTTVPEWAVAPLPTPFICSSDPSSVYAGLIAAAPHLGNVVKDREADAGRRGKYRYVTLGAVMELVRPVLAEAGLGLAQAPLVEHGRDAVWVTVESRVFAADGQWIANRVVLGCDAGADAQAIGSAMTYARRYGLTALLGIASEDDDDAAAAARGGRRSGGADYDEPAPVDPWSLPRFTAEGEPLVDRDTFDRIRSAVHGLDDAARSALTEWRTEAGIRVTPADLTAADALLVLERLGLPAVVEPEPASDPSIPDYDDEAPAVEAPAVPEAEAPADAPEAE